MNVLIVCEFGNLNGAERSLLSTVDNLRSDVIYTAVVPRSGELESAFQQRNIPVYYLDWKLCDKNRPIDDLRKDFHAILQQYKSDIAVTNHSNDVFLVHANSLSSSKMAGQVCQSLNLPSLGHIRDIIRVSKQTISDLNCNSRLACVSQAVKDYHLEQGLDSQKTVVLYNGVDLSTFYPNPTDENNKILKIGTAGQISLRKGMDIFLESALILESRGVKLRYEIAGSRQSNKEETVELERKLTTSASQFPENRFRLLGQLPELSSWLQSLDIYVHTARQEPLGRVLLEAAACGKPVVATDVGGTREIFCCHDKKNHDKNQYSALLVKPNDATAVADAIETIIFNPDLKKEMEILSREIAQQKFSIQTASKNLLNLYRELAKPVELVFRNKR